MSKSNSTLNNGSGNTPKQHSDVYPAISAEALGGSMRGRVVLVTGAGRGIGRAIALSFARAGASGLAILSRTSSELESLAKEIASTYPETRTLVCVADATDEFAVGEAVKNIDKELGRVDVLIANAGKSELRPFAYTPFKDWWQTLEINLKSPMVLTGAILPGMRARNRGVIMLITSTGGIRTLPGASAYSVAKSGIIRACGCLQAELDMEAGGESGIHVYAVHPGGVKTSGTSNALHADLNKMHPGAVAKYNKFLNLNSTPELCGQTCVCIASGRATVLKGKFVDVESDIEDFVNQADIIQREHMYELGMMMLGGLRSEKMYSQSQQ